MHKRSHKWFGFISWNNCWQSAKMPIPVLLTRPLCMRVAPNALRRKWVKKGLKSRWRRRQGIRRS
ncbi:Uncharacterised protein [Vibrio cholerae]|nr:Uncharacterised protein [Vibrio cholerae]CSD25964.1 Uncharacterised protein [Vibrio cholerae]